jgi:electron transfer flavoprotein alpha subunit
MTAAVALAKSLGATWTAGLWGADVQKGADQIASCGAVKILGVTGPAMDEPKYASDASAAAALVKTSGATLVVAPAVSRINRVAGGLARRLGGRVDTHVTELSAEGGKVSAVRWYYRQRLNGSLTRASRPWILTVDPGTQVACACAPGKAVVESVPSPAVPTKTKVTGKRAPSGGTQTIRPDANLLFVAGAGWCKKQADGGTHVPQAEKLIGDFLSKTQSSLGGSKSMVDQSGEGQVISFMSHMNQIGQTGSTPRHPKGLATCCHGEEPHVVGWRFITERRAVNLNAGCGWAQGKADVLYVADAFKVMEEINKLV